MRPTQVVLARVRPPRLLGAARQFRSVHAFTTTAATATSRDCHHPNTPQLDKLKADPRLKMEAGSTAALASPSALAAAAAAPNASTRVDVGPFGHYTLTRQQLLQTHHKMLMHASNHEERMARMRGGGDLSRLDAGNNWTPCGSFAKDEPNTPLGLRRCIDYEKVRGPRSRPRSRLPQR